MGKIFCLMGMTASGKDTVYKMLLKSNELKLKKIVPYTTRPVRENEENGVQYFFTDEDGFNRLVAEGRVIEARAYNTVHGLWRYFTVEDHQIDLSINNYIIIGTPEAYVKLRDYFGNDVVIPIYIELDDGIRLQRALDREKSQSSPKYAEMCRRYLADLQDFSEENLNHAGVVNRFANDDLDICVNEIRNFIGEIIRK